MNGWELFERFAAHGTSTEDIAPMTLDELTQQIHELRSDEPDAIDMTDAEIAQAILEYAREDA